jgi:S-DNA-T family DNA segregation ATPase FtsK/SpoIIIE
VADSALSRRLSELTGVALFAAALIWLVALVSYTPADPVWFFNSVERDAGNFAGRVGAFMAEASFQLVGYAAFILPALVGYVAWHRFWCRDVDAGYTKLIGSAALVLSVASLLALATSGLAGGDRRFGAGGAAGEWTSGLLSAYLNRTGAAILLLMILALSIILSTQFSFGRAASAVAGRVRANGSVLDRLRAWRDERARDRERRAIVDKHVKRAGKERAPEISTKVADAAERLKAARAKATPEPEEVDDQLGEDMPPRPKAPAIRRATPVP